MQEADLTHAPGTKLSGEDLVEVLKNANAATMENRSIIAVGPDLKTAFTRALMAEEAARSFVSASLLGKLGHCHLKKSKKLKK